MYDKAREMFDRGVTWFMAQCRSLMTWFLQCDEAKQRKIVLATGVALIFLFFVCLKPGCVSNPKPEQITKAASDELTTANSQFEMGEKFANGTEVSRDDDEAARWYRKAADQGHAGAQNALGGKCQHKVDTWRRQK